MTNDQLPMTNACTAESGWGHLSLVIRLSEVKRLIPSRVLKPNADGSSRIARRLSMRWAFGVLGVLGILLAQGAGWAGEPVAVITEIRREQGEVRVRPAGEADWRLPQLLLALRPGDQVSAEGESRTVLVFTGGGAQVVSQANSPFTVQAPAGETGIQRLGALVARVTTFLLGQQKDLTTYRSLSVRSTRGQVPLILSPRETRLLAGPVTFEWAGPDRLRYSVRVLGPQGLVWGQASLPRQTLGYPATAPALSPGVTYTWELETSGHPVQRTQFELLPDAEAARVQAALALVQPASLPGYPRNTVTLMRAGLFFQERLYHDARRELLARIKADPDEPTLHLLLGQVYDRVGLKELAEEEFREAQILTTRKS